MQSEEAHRMRVVKKMTVDEIRQTFFGPLKEAANSSRPWTEVTPTWCELSETRLFSQIIQHKPAGVHKQIQLDIITQHMNHVFEDEVDDYEDYLSPTDLVTLRKRREVEKKEGEEVMKFEPIYRIRPTVAQVIEKLDTLYDMKMIDELEEIPEYFENSSDFFLPEGLFSELIQEQETRGLAALSQETKTPRHSSGAPPAKKRRRRLSTDSDSRASSPRLSKHDNN